MNDVVDPLDLTAIVNAHDEGRGYLPYHPRMMVKVLLYGDCTGVYSSRKIARQLEDSVALRFLDSGNQPDFRTLSDFRKRHGTPSGRAVRAGAAAVSQGRAGPVGAGCHRWDKLKATPPSTRR